MQSIACLLAVLAVASAVQVLPVAQYGQYPYSSVYQHRYGGNFAYSTVQNPSVYNYGYNYVPAVSTAYTTPVVAKNVAYPYVTPVVSSVHTPVVKPVVNAYTVPAVSTYKTPVVYNNGFNYGVYGYNYPTYGYNYNVVV